MSLKSPSCRIAVSQFIVFGLLTYIFVTLGLTLTPEKDPNFLITRNAFYTVAGCFGFPLALSLLLLYGVLKEKLLVIRIWLLTMIPLTVLLLLLLLGAAVYDALNLRVYWGIILCAMPFVLALWMSEGIIVVFSYYKKEEFRTRKENLVHSHHHTVIYAIETTSSWQNSEPNERRV